jgi:hypothetical protein
MWSGRQRFRYDGSGLLFGISIGKFAPKKSIDEPAHLSIFN